MENKEDSHFRDMALRWRHNGLDSVSSHQPHNCLLNRSFGRRSKKTSKLRVTDLCVGNSPVTGEFPAQMASNAENVSIIWRHHGSKRSVQIMWKQWVAKFYWGSICGMWLPVLALHTFFWHNIHQIYIYTYTCIYILYISFDSSCVVAFHVTNVKPFYFTVYIFYR